MFARCRAPVVVPLALLLLGTVSAVLVPPFQTPDEAFSFLRAYHVADGHLWPEPVAGWGGGRFPVEIWKFPGKVERIAHKPEEKFTRADWDDLAAVAFGGETAPCYYPTAAPYTFVPYLPQAAGIRAGHALGLRPLGLFYAGRFANLLFGTALVAVALALAPVGRAFFALVALLPMTVHLLASYAPEVTVIGAGLLIPAVVLRLALADGRRAGWWELGLLVLAVAGIGACKPPYLPLAALACAIPAARFGGQFRRVLFLGVLCAVGGTVGAAGVELTRPYYPDPNEFFGFQVSVKEQTRFVAEHPFWFAGAAVSGTAARAMPMYFRLFNLGWLDTPLDPITVSLFTVVLVLAAAAGRAELGVKLPRWPAALAFLAACGLIALSMYVWCAPVGHPVVVGFHGRYLLPLVPLGLFLAPGRVPRSLAPPGVRRAVAVWAAGIMSAVAFGAVINRYYFAEPALVLRGPVILAAGVLLAAFIHARPASLPFTARSVLARLTPRTVR